MPALQGQGTDSIDVVRSCPLEARKYCLTARRIWSLTHHVSVAAGVDYCQNRYNHTLCTDSVAILSYTYDACCTDHGTGSFVRMLMNM